MAPRTIYLVSDRTAAHQRAHFSIFVPSATNPSNGTLIHAIGAPMFGYTLVFRRNYSPEPSNSLPQIWAIGEVDSQHIVDTTGEEITDDSDPRGDIEKAASQCPAPRISENFMAPVNETTNKRCQEWTMDFVRKLVELGYIGQSAVDIVQSHRDPPNHGIGLRPVG